MSVQDEMCSDHTQKQSDIAKILRYNFKFCSDMSRLKIYNTANACKMQEVLQLFHALLQFEGHNVLKLLFASVERSASIILLYG